MTVLLKFVAVVDATLKVNIGLLLYMFLICVHDAAVCVRNQLVWLFPLLLKWNGFDCVAMERTLD